MLKHALFASTIAALLSGCAPQPRQYTAPSPSPITVPKKASYNIDMRIDENEVKWFGKKGRGTINGQAFLRQKGGGVVKAAGEKVYLAPATDYYLIRIKSFQLEDLGGTVSGKDLNESKYMKTTTSDADGKFSFVDLPNGKYVVGTKVVWHVPGEYGSERQGGFILKTVELSGGKAANVIINQ
jgi:hypothetical protein